MSQQQSVKNNEEKIFPYLKVVKSIITSPRLTPSDIRTYLVIASHYNSVTGLTFPALPTIAKEAGLHIQTILKSRKKLKELGLIQWRVKKTEKKSCQYELPLITGTPEQQQEVVEYLRYSEKTTLPDTTKNSVVDSTKNSVVGRVKNSTTNKKNYQKEINKQADPVSSLSFLVQDQIQEQKYFFQENWKEWKISSESLKKYKLLNILLWTLEIQEKVERGFEKGMAAGALVNGLKGKRQLTDEEGKIHGLIWKWLPEELSVVYVSDDFFPRCIYLQELSKEYKKPVKDLLEQGILANQKIDDDGMKYPLLDEFTPEQKEIMKQGKFEGLIKDYKKRLVEEQARVERVDNLRRDPEGFFETIEKNFWEGERES